MNSKNKTISADTDKCSGCGTCTYLCPFHVISLVDRVPQMNPGKKCLECLHCAAACPNDAILYYGETAIIHDLVPSFSTHFDSDLVTHLTRRRSYRHFKDEAPDRDILYKALTLSDFAPSAKNQHPVSWLVIHSKTRCQQIMEHILDYVKETGTSPEIWEQYQEGNNVVMGTAPALIMAYCGADALNPMQDTALAINTVELYLQTKGIGTCWAGYLTRLSNAVPALKELFALPDGCQFTGALMIGYPLRETYPAVPRRAKPSSIRWME